MKTLFQKTLYALIAMLFVLLSSFMIAQSYELKKFDTDHPTEIQISDSTFGAESSAIRCESEVILRDSSDYFISSDSISPISEASLNFLPILMMAANWVGRFLRKGRQFTEDHVIPAMNIVQAVHSVLDSKTVDALTKAIPGEWDDDLVDKMKSSLATAIRSFNLVDESVKRLSVNELIEQYLAWLSEQPDVVQAAMAHKTASIIAANRSRHQFSEYETDLLVQAQYTATKANQAVEA